MPSKSAAAEGKTPTTITVDADLLKRFRSKATELTDEHRISKQVEIAMNHWLESSQLPKAKGRESGRQRFEPSDHDEQEALRVFTEIYRHPRNRLESSIKELVKHAAEMRRTEKS